jgi:ABC-type lipoprotein export system ATPase subunit
LFAFRRRAVAFIFQSFNLFPGKCPIRHRYQQR